MDEIDAAQERIEIDLGNAIRQARQGGPVAMAKGRCLYCDDVTGDEQRWCDSFCRDAWSKLRGAR